jgi:hypothetical protein
MTGRKVKLPAPDGSGATIEGTEVQVSESTERWSEFTLEDGTIVRAKQVMSSAIRVDGQYDNEGKPVYIGRGAAMFTIVSVPDHLLKKDNKGSQ